MNRRMAQPKAVRDITPPIIDSSSIQQNMSLEARAFSLINCLTSPRHIRHPLIRPTFGTRACHYSQPQLPATTIQGPSSVVVSVGLKGSAYITMNSFEYIIDFVYS
jgi:hypothetical protein